MPLDQQLAPLVPQIGDQLSHRRIIPLTRPGIALNADGGLIDVAGLCHVPGHHGWVDDAGDFAGFGYVVGGCLRPRITEPANYSVKGWIRGGISPPVDGNGIRLRSLSLVIGAVMLCDVLIAVSFTNASAYTLTPLLIVLCQKTISLFLLILINLYLPPLIPG